MKLCRLRFRRQVVRAAVLAITLCLFIGVLLMRNVENQENIDMAKNQNMFMKKLRSSYNQIKRLSNFSKLNLKVEAVKHDTNLEHLRDESNKLMDIPEDNRQVDIPEDSKLEDILGFHKEPNLKAEFINYNVHVFYYPWYGNPKYNGEYIHWNHPFLPHWNKNEAQKWPQGEHEPPGDIGANFYPELGPYSSNDPKIIAKHMEQIAFTGVGVVVVSWYPPNDADDQGKDPDKLVPIILDIADKFNIKVTLHIEPYKGRNHTNMRENLKYILNSYGKHPAFYKHYHKDKKKNLPMFYIYDSYQVRSNLWGEIFKSDGSITVRGTELDGIFIGLLAEMRHSFELLSGGFDGMYTYFATDGFTYGSSWQNWDHITDLAKSNKLIFIPSVGPGYIDTNVRPWNAKNSRSRESGQYFLESINAALQVKPEFISVTSFNEWHEGTQIEPAIPMKHQNLIYLDYGSKGPKYYLELTKYLVEKFSEMQQSDN